MNWQTRIGVKSLTVAAALSSMVMAQSCVATRNWVREQMDPLGSRVSQNETRLNESDGRLSSLDGRIGGVEGKVGQIDGRLGQIDAKAEKALSGLANLRLERRFVIDMREGANFKFGSANLSPQTRKEIDGFLSDLKGDPAGLENTVFLIAGHTDSVGSENYNYELGKKRAEAVSRYLVTQKKMDPLRIVTVSYGEDAPLVENNSSQNRAKNRRVEILVYREGINANSPSASAAANPAGSQQPSDRVSSR
ncbi:MAG TPA: OmpA family protein [Terriglobales bacterium]|nr:OmpA family protein [Terriglobales bacterium]